MTTMIDGPFGRIACTTSNGSGPAVVLVHGNSASSRAFARQLDGPLGEKLRLIAFDLPGHGGSDDTEMKNYTLPGYASALRQVVAHFDARDAVLVGWSLGGHIVLEAAPDLPEARGFAIFGTPPLGIPPDMASAFLPNPAMAFTFAETLDADQAKVFLAGSFRPGFDDVASSFREDLARTDGRARSGLAASIGPDGYRDEIKVAEKLKQPLAVLHGRQEQLISIDYLRSLAMPTLWRGAVQIIDGAGHAPQWEQPAAFDELIEAFVRDCAGPA